MGYFRYKVMKPSGEVVAGIANLPFEDVMSAMSYLESGDDTTISVKKMGALSSAFFRILKNGVRKKVDRKTLAEWFNNLSIMVRSGLPLATALEESSSSLNNSDFESDINDIILSIRRGSGFSAAIERQAHLFPKTTLHLIRIGEESGTLDERLKDAADHLNRIDGIIRDTKQALLYPMFIFLTMGGGLVFWFYFVVPKIVTLFDEMEVDLPQLTIIIIGISTFVQTYIMELATGAFLVVASLTIAYKKMKPVKKIFDYIFLKIPVMGTLIQASTLAFITEYFSLLLNAGIDIIQSVNILEESVGNAVYQEQMGKIKTSLAAGTGVTDSFSRSTVFPRFICRMISIGEKSGTLPEQLSYIAQDYKQKLETLVASLSKVIEPVVLIFAGIMFAIIMAGLFLPIYDLVGSLSAG